MRLFPESRLSFIINIQPRASWFQGAQRYLRITVSLYQNSIPLFNEIYAMHILEKKSTAKQSEYIYL
jgi:hypothetical protein